MHYEARFIYKDGSCAVFDKIRKIEVNYETIILHPCDLLKPKYTINRHNSLKALKIAVKEY